MTTKKTTKKTSKKSAPAKKAAGKKTHKVVTSALPPVVAESPVVAQVEKVEKAFESAAVRKSFFAKIKSWF